MCFFTVNNIVAYNYNGMKNDGTYDPIGNGSLTRDGNRGINSITYDYGHHTYKINLDINNGPRNITNDYTPDGRKLSSKHVTSIPKVNGFIKKTTTDLHIDGLILRNGSPLLWQFGGGYVDLNANGAPTCWNYYVTDHLGSTRMVVSSNDSIRETINYYPFGSEMQMQAPALLTENLGHPFRFTGKELDRLSALNMYDFGARWYDVAGVPMWTSIDPLAEKYYNVSPYAYCGGNPVNAIDPDGRACGDYYTNNGAYVGSDEKDDDKAYVSDSKGDVSFMNQKFSELSVSNSTLNQFANTVAQESSGNKLESYALASAIMNISLYKHKTISETLKSEGIYGYKDGGSSTKYNKNKEYGMEAALNALSGGEDLSNGALRWDGFDLAAKGFNHVKARTAGISISSDHFNSFKSAWPNRMIKAYSGGKFREFSNNFEAGNYPATQGPYKGLTLYQSSAVYGRTIFWTPIKNKDFNGTY